MKQQKKNWPAESNMAALKALSHTLLRLDMPFFLARMRRKSSLTPSVSSILSHHNTGEDSASDSAQPDSTETEDAEVPDAGSTDESEAS